jgi:hypothetical protein
MKLLPIAKEFFSNNPSAGDFRNIQNFAFIVRYTEVPLLTRDDIRGPIASILMGKLTEKLDALGIYAANTLKCKSSDQDGIQIDFMDDIYHFQITMDSEKFAFLRQAGTLEHALIIAELLLDEVTSIYDEISTFLEGLREQGGPTFVFSPYYCSWTYDFNIKNLKPATKSQRSSYTNYELMERLVPSVQTESSPLYSVGFENRGRTDLKISGTITIADISYRAWITIEAPGNMNFSTMELRFQLASELLDNPDGTRTPFNAESIQRWRDSAIPFLKERVFCGFLQDWLNDVSFESV